MKRQFFGILTAITVYVTPVVAEQADIDWTTFDIYKRCDGVVMFDQTSDSGTYSGYTIFRLPDGRVYFERYEDGTPVGYGTFTGSIYQLPKMSEVALDQEDEMYTYRSDFFFHADTPDWNGGSEKLRICEDDSKPIV